MQQSYETDDELLMVTVCMCTCLGHFSCVQLFVTLGLLPARLLCPQDSPGKNTEVGCQDLLQEILSTHGSNPHLPCLLHWQAVLYHLVFPHSSGGKESACNAGDPSLIPGSGRSTGEGIGYPLQYSWASPVVQLVKETAFNVGNLGLSARLQRSPGEGKGYPLQYSGLENSMNCIVHGVTMSLTRLSGFHVTSFFITSTTWRALMLAKAGSLDDR